MAGKASKSASAKAGDKIVTKREYTVEDKKLSKMVGFLRYQQNATTIDDSKRDAAKEALEIYRTLSDKSSRMAFLANYEQAGCGNIPIL